MSVAKRKLKALGRDTGITSMAKFIECLRLISIEKFIKLCKQSLS